VIHFDLAARQAKIDDVNQKMLGEGFWDNQRKAQALINEANYEKQIISPRSHSIASTLHPPGTMERGAPRRSRLQRSHSRRSLHDGLPVPGRGRARAWDYYAKESTQQIQAAITAFLGQ
jgi:hypothetical protein